MDNQKIFGSNLKKYNILLEKNIINCNCHSESINSSLTQISTLEYE